MSRRQMMRIRWKKDAWTFAALLALVALTCGAAYLPMGGANGLVSLAIAAAKASLVVAMFMRLPSQPSLLKLAAGAGLFMLAVFFTLTFSDYVTR